MQVHHENAPQIEGRLHVRWQGAAVGAAEAVIRSWGRGRGRRGLWWRQRCWGRGGGAEAAGRLLPFLG